MKNVHITSRAAARMRQGHPWVYRGDILKMDDAKAGEPVVIRDGPRMLGTGFYSSQSLIAVRRASRKVIPLDRAFIHHRLEQALELRRRVWGELPGAFRWVHGEADGLPGLVVDCMGTAVSVQVLAQGTARLEEDVLQCVVELRQPQTLVLRNDVPAREKEGLPLEKKLWRGDSSAVSFAEGEITMHVDLLEGQKTGTFLDQRDNHILAGTLARGTGLDCFSGDGGFALQLARRCSSVLAVDSSAPATTRIEQNARSNGLSNLSTRTDNAFDFLRAEVARGAVYQTVVLDPPAFAKGRRHVESALRGYKELNLRALQMLAPGGVLVTCSCSQPVGMVDFMEMLRAASEDTERDVQVLHQRGAGPDHPVALGFAESDYLKCVVLRVAS